MRYYWRNNLQPYQQDSRFFGLWPFVAGLALGPLLFNPFLYGRPYPPPYPVYPPYAPYPVPVPVPTPSPYGAYPGVGGYPGVPTPSSQF